MRRALVDYYYSLIHMELRPLYRELMDNTRLSLAELEKMQQGLLSEMLSYAIENVPYYGARAAHPEINCFSPLRKQDIDAHFEEFKPPGSDDPLNRVAMGSGTTRISAKVIIDRQSLAWGRAANWRAQQMRGVPLHSRSIHLRRDPIYASRWQRFKRRVGQVMLDQYIFDGLKMDEKRVRSLHRIMRILRPRYLGGFTSNIVALAEVSEQLGLKPPRLHHVVAYGENIYPQTREKISRYFGVPVHGGYGAREVGFIASTCSMLRYHTAPELNYLEVLCDDGEIRLSGTGRLLITPLRNHAMPLVRYDIGDYVTISGQPCPCGLPQPVIDELHGRSSEVVLRPDGMLVTSNALVNALSYLNVHDWRATQEREGHVLIEMVKNEYWGEADEKQLSRDLSDFFEDIMEVELRFVESIAPLKNGKRPTVLNLLPGRY